MPRRLNALSRMLASGFRRLPFPYKLTFAATWRCDSRCATCSIWQKPPADELSAEEIGDFFARSDRFSWLGLTGGEPFLRTDLPRIAKSADRHCRDLAVIGIPTNGYRTREIVEAVREMAADCRARIVVTVSVDGPPRLHDRLRGRQGSWRNALATFAGLRALKGTDSFLSMTLSPLNADRIDETVRSLREAVPGFRPERDLNFNLLHVSPHYYANGHLGRLPAHLKAPALERALGLLYEPFSLKGFLQTAYLDYGKDYLKTGASPLPCRALSASCFMDPCGTVYPCHAFDRPLGNVRDRGSGLEPIWNAGETLRAYEACRDGRCPGCWSPCDAYPCIVGSLGPAVLRYLVRGLRPGAVFRALTPVPRDGKSRH